MSAQENNIMLPKLELTYTGEIIEKILLNLENEYKNVNIYDYIIMPNHIHFVIELCEWADTGPAPTIPEIICSFKTRTTYEIIKEIKNNRIEPFKNKIWQRNYYEHVIRKEKEYLEIAEYINNNPYNWEKDEYYQ